MTLNLTGRLLDLDTPMVMGILNVTPDSFYAGSRTTETSDIQTRAAQLISEGAAIIDVGACSTRPGASLVDADEELRRLDKALRAIRQAHPDAILSIDTYRSSVARHCVNEWGADIINDPSGGALDEQMFDTVAALHVPYILTHSGGYADDAVADAPDHATSDEAFLASVARWFAERLQALHTRGVADVILDPGFGFGKTQAQSYALLSNLSKFTTLFSDNAFLVGVSRKSMIYKCLNTTPEGALNGSTVLHTVALQAGARLIRTHDVREAMEVVTLCSQLHS